MSIKVIFRVTQVTGRYCHAACSCHNAICIRINCVCAFVHASLREYIIIFTRNERQRAPSANDAKHVRADSLENTRTKSARARACEMMLRIMIMTYAGENTPQHRAAVCSDERSTPDPAVYERPLGSSLSSSDVALFIINSAHAPRQRRRRRAPH